MPAPESIRQLVAQFTQNREAYRSGKYNEAQLRQEFLNPFFEALGWDMVNRSGYAPQNREVIHEDSVDFEGGSRAPDYAFRLGQTRKFFVEAKKPAVDIQYDIHPAYQLRRYAWNLHLPLSILTDFEEFAVYDCRNRPNPSDSAATARVLFFKYTQYIEKWDEIAAIFSREAVWKGSFDQYAADNTAKKGTSEVDDAFLDDIEKWRDLLARNIALRNPQVSSERQLNYAVQMTIDRLIFLRICEDRGIEPEFQLQELSKSPGIYPSLVALFQRADLKYNSGLFHFKAEKGESNAADTFTPSLVVDDRVLKEIIKSLYYPCPYIFKEIPVEILGQVYEQFLGKVIRLTPAHQVKVEPKPEVRKAGGVYYTPKYIVEYIVRHTVGALLEEKTPESAAALKILDPACGSGSFLLGAFQHLLDWHLAWYTAHDPEKWTRGKSPALVPAGGGAWQLTTAEKKRILVNNIHGVDIDAQAVEVTKLSLLLKVLEEETGQLSLGLERVLPDLGRNIQCGNSLIGWDYFAGQLVPDEKEVERVNPFEWHAAFPEVFAHGGFDVVIGNPPYIKEYSNNQPFHDLRGTRLEKYYQGKMDIWYIFSCLAIDILKRNGLHGFIATNNWHTNSGASSLRTKITSETEIIEFIDFGDFHVFETAGIQTMIFILLKSEFQADRKIHYRRVNNPKITSSEIIDFLNQESTSIGTSSFYVNQGSLKTDGTVITFNVTEDEELLNKIDQPSYLKLEEHEVAQGIVLPQETVLEKHLSVLKDKSISVGDGIFLLSSVEVRNLQLSENEMHIIKPFFTSRQLGRYFSDPMNDTWLIYSDKNVISQINKFPNIKKHLLKFSNVITSDNKPYGLHRPRNEHFFVGDKIISFRKTDKPQFTLVNFPCYITQTFNVIKTERVNLRYLLGILNSNLIFFWLDRKGKKQGNALQIDKAPLLSIPIRAIDFTNPADVQRHDQMVALVERMLALHQQLAAALLPQEKESLARQIHATDAQIDRLVYELYGLTEEEIRLVEGS